MPAIATHDRMANLEFSMDLTNHSHIHGENVHYFHGITVLSERYLYHGTRILIHGHDGVVKLVVG